MTGASGADRALQLSPFWHCKIFHFYFAIFSKMGLQKTGVGIFIAAIAIEAASENKIMMLKLLPILLFWCWFTFSFTYGNAMAEQKRYNEFRMQVVIDDLKDLNAIKSAEQNNKEVQVMFIGNAGFSPVLRNMQKTWEYLNKAVT